MPERNLCTESGCKAYCCFGPKFPWLKIDREQVLAWFPEAKQTLSISLVSFKNIKGVYYKLGGNGYRIKIVGYCPNLDEGFNCKLESNKPGPCKEYGLGQDDCIGVRLTYFLPTYREWAYQRSKSSKDSQSSG